MATPVAVTKLESKSHDRPDETRTPAKSRVEIVRLEGFTMGRLTVQLKAGAKKTFSAGDSYTIPPGHDAWVEGNERFVGIEVTSAEQYAKA
jgi:hypothetical protein